MSGWKSWQIGEVVEASDFQSFVQDQVVQVYADSAARGSALGTAVSEGMVSYLQDVDATEVYNGASWQAIGAGDITDVVAGTALTGGGSSGSVTLNVDETELFTGGTSGFTALSAGTAGLSFQPVSHNYIINGGFDIWQRGTSFTFPLSDSRIADRYTVTSSTTRAKVVTQEQLTVAEQEQVGARYFLRFDTTGETVFDNRIGHAIEGIELAGKQVTLSYWARTSLSSATTELEVRVYRDSSTDNRITVSTPDVSSTLTRYSTTFTMPSTPAGTPDSSARVLLFFKHESAAQQFDITGIQLEAGSVATPFKRHAPSLQGELAACQRYFVRYNSAGVNAPISPVGMASTTTAVLSIYSFPVAMRVAPTSITFSGLSWLDTTAAYSASSASVSAANTLTAQANLVVTGATAQRAGFIGGDTSSSFIAFSAEL